jgi:hypothetical protein
MLLENIVAVEQFKAGDDGAPASILKKMLKG